ncbi:gluconate 2-dehydrogenase subunit 3 family protein [Flavobacteriaceae bacterium]|uniref:gluconate 2-dehydrogenase subunit 3 family protein n=1 Tax=Candidatus Arcticimaribacter forsetii TaxID=2820661 RepID=UPI0020771EAD|nr:gluconate 2-dehydrogenase subunit 3 family protein [Candidatus Arcticimaribacter forsetii]MDA8699561.1 gluconate 2-dehydrogenase subunit 3 family protein [Flavobacteriaceae bacterium]MDB2330002.1 gluconate 2-dehydrogenase subunit 3 family protein [Flavobacteriaceae bacterium]MDB4620419.1 gluconate 2-dehydrogenase subunit 3 family protein [Flavobacteriaceae bacterium]MDB4674115.1 gluconate 2-dehydrogenase subunit 3 family protein [Flavobacteriaceae bacterium]MDB4717182.1 gluconate 2-dehydrog
MQRRTALKNIGLSLGALTLSSTVVGLFESCQTGTAAWQPEFLSLEQADLVDKIMDVILPTTENIPGAKDLNLTQFLDGYMAKVSSPEDKEFTLLGLPLVSKLMLEASGKSQVSELTSQDIDDQLNRFLRADPATKESRQNDLNSWAEALENGEQISVPEEGVVQTMLNSIRDLSVFAFKNSELIGETVLAYSPVPGEQQGCISVSDATGGRAWSL